jgi:hypothetical protein
LILAVPIPMAAVTQLGVTQSEDVIIANWLNEP